jgi:RNA polymerase sigma-70 factor (ECF subfamily)
MPSHPPSPRSSGVPDPNPLDEDEDSTELESETQPREQGGVEEDMASLALNPTQTGQVTDPAFIESLEAVEKLLIQKYRKPIIHFMYRMVRNQAVAEELAQEVFLRVYRSRETYRAEARFSTWLYRIATNLGVNHARDNRHERNASTVYLDEADSETGTTPDVADTTPGAEANLLRRERLNAIREHVMALPERQRVAVLMHKYEGMDYRQIGDVLKLSESATKSLLFRAYQTLREKLKPFI